MDEWMGSVVFEQAKRLFSEEVVFEWKPVC